MGYVALLLSIIVMAVIVTACVLPSQNQPTSGLKSEQQDAARQILVNEKMIGNLSDVGKPEVFNIGYNTTHTLAILPVMQKDSQFVDSAFIVDLDRNITVARVNCGIKNLTFNRVKTLANLTVNAPVVSDDFWDLRTHDFTIGIDGYEDTAPGFINWSGRFISISTSSLVQIPHKIAVVIDDQTSRVIDVQDEYWGIEYMVRTRYVVLPPGTERYYYLAPYGFYQTAKYPNLWMAKVTFEPNDSKIYPIIVDGDNFSSMVQGASFKPLEYRDFVTDNLQRYGGDRSIATGWTANISLDHRTNIVLVVKSAETNKDVQAWIDVTPNLEMDNIIHEVWLRETNKNTTAG